MLITVRVIQNLTVILALLLECIAVSVISVREHVMLPELRDGGFDEVGWEYTWGDREYATGDTWGDLESRREFRI